MDDSGRPTEVVLVQSRDLWVGDNTVHYLAIGSGPPVVLLHGGASTSSEWLGPMAELSGTHAAYALDMIGYGRSSRHERGYYLSDLAETVERSLDKLGLGSVTLVGHSLGGRVAMEVAFREPGRVERLVLVDTMGFSPLAMWAKAVGAVTWSVRRLFKHPQPFPTLLLKEGEDHNWICLDRLPRLNMPTLIVWNLHDPYFSVKGAIEASRLIPDARLKVIPGFGHSPHVGNARLFNDLLMDFLDEYPQRSGVFATG